VRLVQALVAPILDPELQAEVRVLVRFAVSTTLAALSPTSAAFHPSGRSRKP